MIVFPKAFVKLRYPGYFWNLEEELLYTIKSGTLRRLGQSKPIFLNGRQRPRGYQLSVSGVRRFIDLETLKALKNSSKIETVDLQHYVD